MELDLVSIINAVIAIGVALAGGVMGYIWRARKAVQEGGELLTALADALADKSVSQQELDRILREFDEFKAAIKAIKGK